MARALKQAAIFQIWTSDLDAKSFWAESIVEEQDIHRHVEIKHLQSGF
jgi:hypothetical protein